ncbi:MAG: hypothetical protein ACKVP0_08750 [Pirellulaceae bacterium]
MLLGNDVVYLMREQRCCLGQLAVFTAIIGAPKDIFSKNHGDTYGVVPD